MVSRESECLSMSIYGHVVIQVDMVDKKADKVCRGFCSHIGCRREPNVDRVVAMRRAIRRRL